MRQRRKETSATCGLPVESLCLDMVRFVHHGERVYELHLMFPRPQPVYHKRRRPPRERMLQ